jgi:CheY-like chemotaxis protein
MKPEPAILVVEDDEDDSYFMQRALRTAGAPAEPSFVTNGVSALQYLRGQGEFANRQAQPLPALVFLDLKMPFMGGLEVLATIRGDPVLKELRVYVLTSSNEERDREQALALGVDGYLLKPPTPKVLGPIVETIRGDRTGPNRVGTSEARS